MFSVALPWERPWSTGPAASTPGPRRGPSPRPAAGRRTCFSYASNGLLLGLELGHLGGVVRLAGLEGLQADLHLAGPSAGGSGRRGTSPRPPCASSFSSCTSLASRLFGSLDGVGDDRAVDQVQDRPELHAARRARTRRRSRGRLAEQVEEPAGQIDVAVEQLRGPRARRQARQLRSASPVARWIASYSTSAGSRRAMACE